jgi:hypothetical protein
VQLWQLQVMHFALVRCWRYRAGHVVGKLQYRLVRELNRVSWSVRMLPQQQQQQQQQGVDDRRVWRQFQRMRWQKRAMLRGQLGTLHKQHEQQQQRGHMQQQSQLVLRSAGGPAAAAAAGSMAQDNSAQPRQTGQKLKQGQQKQKQLSSAGKVAAGGRRSIAGGRRGTGQAVVSLARRLAVLQMQQRAAAVWPRQWEPLCLSAGDWIK